MTLHPSLKFGLMIFSSLITISLIFLGLLFATGLLWVVGFWCAKLFHLMPAV